MRNYTQSFQKRNDGGIKVVMDGNNLLFRVLSLSVFWRMKEGNTPVGGLYGFLNSFLMYKKRYRAGDFILVWDGGRSKRRMKQSRKTYKANREIDKGFSEVFSHQKELCSRVAKWLGIRVVEIFGKEADDVIYEIVRAFKKKCKIVVVSSDRDFFQLLEDNVVIWRPGENRIVVKEDAERKLGLEIRWYVYLKALEGDTSDNISKVAKSPKRFLKQLVEECNGDENLVYKVLEQIYGDSFVRNFELIKLGLEEFSMQEISRLNALLTKQIYSDKDNVERVLKMYKWWSLLKRFKEVYG